jgi:hypothetical protein
MRPSLPRDTERRACGGEGLEYLKPRECDEMRDGEYKRWAGTSTLGHGLTR